MLRTKLTRCRHIGTLPPAGIGSLRDCGIVQRGNLPTMQRNQLQDQSTQSKTCSYTLEQCTVHKSATKVSAAQADDYTCCTAHVCRETSCRTQGKSNYQMNACKHCGDLCIMHRLSCQPSQHRCWGSQQCTLTCRMQTTDWDTNG